MFAVCVNISNLVYARVVSFANQQFKETHRLRLSSLWFYKTGRRSTVQVQRRLQAQRPMIASCVARKYHLYKQNFILRLTLNLFIVWNFSGILKKKFLSINY